MPTYDYRCTACGHAFESVQSMTAPVKRKCPACSKLKLERLIGTGAGFIIKGRSAAPPPKDSTPAPAPSETSKTSKTDSTPAADAPEAGTSTDKKPKEAPADKPTPPKTPAASDPPEKRISGATSTPTHAAREGRGVGNLVDKARRLAKGRAASPKKRAPRRPAKGDD